MFVSQLGTQFARVAIYIQVFALTRSYVAVGFTGLIALAALVLGTIVASSFIDATDRRTVLIASQVAYGAAAGVLLATALANHPPLWPIYAANAATAFISAIESPSRQAMTVRLVGRELVPPRSR
jgi:MFS family permease